MRRKSSATSRENSGVSFPRSPGADHVNRENCSVRALQSGHSPGDSFASQPSHSANAVLLVSSSRWFQTALAPSSTAVWQNQRSEDARSGDRNAKYSAAADATPRLMQASTRRAARYRGIFISLLCHIAVLICSPTNLFTGWGRHLLHTGRYQRLRQIGHFGLVVIKASSGLQLVGRRKRAAWTKAAS